MGFEDGAFSQAVGRAHNSRLVSGKLVSMVVGQFARRAARIAMMNVTNPTTIAIGITIQIQTTSSASAG